MLRSSDRPEDRPGIEKVDRGRETGNKKGDRVAGAGSWTDGRWSFLPKRSYRGGWWPLRILRGNPRPGFAAAPRRQPGSHCGGRTGCCGCPRHRRGPEKNLKSGLKGEEKVKRISWERMFLGQGCPAEYPAEEGLGGSVKTEGFRQGEPFAGQL